MIEKHIILEDIDPITFYGVNNSHLQMVRSLYPKLRIMARDNVIRVLGDEEVMCQFEEDIEKMRRHIMKYNIINEEDILNITKGETTKADAAKGVVVYSLSGKPIKSRSANQQALVDAFEKKDMVFAVGPAGTCSEGAEREDGKEDNTVATSCGGWRETRFSAWRHEG